MTKRPTIYSNCIRQSIDVSFSLSLCPFFSSSLSRHSSIGTVCEKSNLWIIRVAVDLQIIISFNYERQLNTTCLFNKKEHVLQFRFQSNVWTDFIISINFFSIDHHHRWDWLHLQEKKYIYCCFVFTCESMANEGRNQPTAWVQFSFLVKLIVVYRLKEFDDYSYWLTVHIDLFGGLTHTFVCMCTPKRAKTHWISTPIYSITGHSPWKKLFYTSI